MVFQWIPSHCDIRRNENTDAVARQALNTYSTTTQRKVPVRYQNIVSYYKERNKAHYLSALQRKPNTRSALTTVPANLSKDNSLCRRRQAKLAQLRTGISNTMGQYQRLIDGNFSANHNKKCRWCGGLNETVTHVFNDCTDLQIQALRNDIYTKTGKVFNAEYLVNDPINASDFHDRAIGFLHHGEIVL